MRVRRHTMFELDAAFRSVALHLPEPPPVAPPVARYVARHGVAHLVASGAWSEAVMLCDRLAAAGVGPVARNRDSLLRAFVLCPPSAPLNAEAVGRLLHQQSAAAGCRAATDWWVAHRPDAVDAPFEAEPNASRPVTYAMAVSIACSIADEGPAGLSALSSWASDFDRPTQYAAMYALKYAAIQNPDADWQRLLLAHAKGNGDDQIVVAGVLLYLALQGTFVPLDAPEFWAPVWGYVQVEVDLVLGALGWRGLQPVEPGSSAAEFVAYFDELESLRIELIECVEQPAVRGMVDQYWRLVADLDTVDRGLRLIALESEWESIVWLMMASPYWEVGERAAGAAAQRIAADPLFEDTLVEWVHDPDQDAVHMGAMMALRTRAQQTRDHRPLHAIADIAMESPDPQIRGFWANAVVSLFDDVPPSDWPAVLEDWQASIQRGLNDTDMWAVQEVVALVQKLNRAGVPWEDVVTAEEAPLLQGIDEWQQLDWDGLNDRMKPVEVGL